MQNRSKIVTEFRKRTTYVSTTNYDRLIKKSVKHELESTYDPKEGPNETNFVMLKLLLSDQTMSLPAQSFIASDGIF